jgi:hypothetical protein
MGNIVSFGDDNTDNTLSHESTFDIIDMDDVLGSNEDANNGLNIQSDDIGILDSKVNQDVITVLDSKVNQDVSSRLISSKFKYKKVIDCRKYSNINVGNLHSSRQMCRDRTRLFTTGHKVKRNRVSSIV